MQTANIVVMHGDHDFFVLASWIVTQTIDLHVYLLYRLRAKKGPAPPPPLGNFADISYLEEKFKPHLLRDVCTLCSGALVSDSLLHMLLLQTKEKIKMKG